MESHPEELRDDDGVLVINRIADRYISSLDAQIGKSNSSVYAATRIGDTTGEVFALKKSYFDETNKKT